jgi:hypothetical protein
MEIQKTEIYETENWLVRHYQDGLWKIQSKHTPITPVTFEITLKGPRFEELAEILRSIG